METLFPPSASAAVSCRRPSQMQKKWKLTLRTTPEKSELLLLLLLPLGEKKKFLMGQKEAWNMRRKFGLGLEEPPRQGKRKGEEGKWKNGPEQLQKQLIRVC